MKKFLSTIFIFSSFAAFASESQIEFSINQKPLRQALAQGIIKPVYSTTVNKNEEIIVSSDTVYEKNLEGYQLRSSDGACVFEFKTSCPVKHSIHYSYDETFGQPISSKVFVDTAQGEVYLPHDMVAKQLLDDEEFLRVRPKTF